MGDQERVFLSRENEYVCMLIQELQWDERIIKEIRNWMKKR